MTIKRFRLLICLAVLFFLAINNNFLTNYPLETLLILGLIFFLIESINIGVQVAVNLLSQKKNNFSPIKFKYIFIPPKLFFVIALLISIKASWYSLTNPQILFLKEEKLEEDLLKRKNYLVAKIINPTFSPASSPNFLSEAFKEEWAIGTLSMLGSSLTNLAFKYPSLQLEHQKHLKYLIKRMLKDDIYYSRIDFPLGKLIRE